MAYVLEASDMVGYGNGAGTELWTAIPGLLEFEVTRAGPARASKIEAVFAARGLDECGQPAHPRQRFRLRDTAYSTTQNIDILIVGRFDDVEPMEDARHGRIYRVTGRDYLGALADNHLDHGQDSYSKEYTCAWSDDLPWVPNWANATPSIVDVAGEKGQNRWIIIMQLAMNVLPVSGNVPLQGLFYVSSIYTMPNSKPVELNFMDTLEYTILDAIRNVAREDPWSDTQSLVDAEDIVMYGSGAGDPDAGIGGEFQIDLHSGDWSSCGAGQDWQRRGHQATYFKRGDVEWDPSITFTYGAVEKIPGGTAAIPIIAYNLPELGSDIYSRSRVSGKGWPKSVRPIDSPPGPVLDRLLGVGYAFASSELEWDPAAGLYASRRELIDHDESGIADWIFGDLAISDPRKAGARWEKDRAYANLYSGNAALGKYRGAMAGKITVPYFPRNLASQPLVPGMLIAVSIPHLNLTKNLVVESWKYAWPANKMTINLSRNPLRGFGEQVIRGVRKAEGLQQAVADHADQAWWQTDGTGEHRFYHNMGVVPSQINLLAAAPSGDWDAELNPIPIAESITGPAMHTMYEAPEGQYVGWHVIEQTPQYVTIQYSSFVAPDSYVGEWLLDGECILKLILRP